MKNDNHKWDNKHPTAQMLGRWQPWHAGHQKLFEETLKKYNKDEVKIKCCENGIIKHTYTVRKEEYRDGKFGFSAAKICYDEKGRQTRCEENGNQTYP